MKWNFVKLTDASQSPPPTDLEYSPWAMVFYRDHHLMMAADEYAISINSGDTSGIRQYFAVLRQLIINLQALLKPKNIPKWINEIDSIETQLENWEEDVRQGEEYYPKELIVRLRNFHQKIIFIKQYIGFGIPRSGKRSTKEEIKNALLGKNE